MILYAPNINSGGGLVLLNTVIEDKVFGKVSTLFIDERARYKISFNGIKVYFIKPNIISRMLAEIKLKRIICPNEEVIFFGNLPPFFTYYSNSSLFLQNAYLLPNIPYPKSLKMSLRIFFERRILYRFINNIDKILVQTNWMKENIEKKLNKPVKIKAIYPRIKVKHNQIKKYDIIAITGPEPHKNQNILKEVIEHLSVNLKIAIVSSSPPVINSNFVHIDFFNSLSYQEIQNLYSKSKSILILSTFESFCLPLYEAKANCLDIFAPEAGYTRDFNGKYTKIDINSINQTVKTILLHLKK